MLQIAIPIAKCNGYSRHLLSRYVTPAQLSIYSIYVLLEVLCFISYPQKRVVLPDLWGVGPLVIGRGIPFTVLRRSPK